MPDRSPLPFPYDLAGLLPAGIADSLSAIELGALYRLVQLAWAEPTFGHSPGSLPDDPAILARVARVTGQQWDEIAPVVRLVFRPTSGGRIVCPALADLYNREAAIRESRRRAGQCRHGPPQNQGPDPAHAEHVLSMCSAGAGEPATRAARARAERSALKTERNTSDAPEQSQPVGCVAGEERGEIVASLGRRAQELTEIRVAEWRRAQVVSMLREAIGRWAGAGLTTLPAGKVSELASLPASTPARVQAAIEAAEDCLRDAKAAGRACRPVGVLIVRLGATRQPKPPMEPPLQLVELWRRREELARAELEPAAARLARTEQQSQAAATVRIAELRAQAAHLLKQPRQETG